MRARICAVLLALGALGCGSSIGDACSTDQDCGGRTCGLADAFPGGYCTQRCTLGDDGTCPTGASCHVHHGEVDCLRTCHEDVECRSGYTCHKFNGDGPFCLAPGDD
jgi:hypothetical protein